MLISFLFRNHVCKSQEGCHAEAQRALAHPDLRQWQGTVSGERDFPARGRAGLRNVGSLGALRTRAACEGSTEALLLETGGPVAPGGAVV